METFPSIIDIFPFNWVLIKTGQQQNGHDD